MVKGMETLYRVKNLLVELQLEMKNLQKETQLHREELPYIEKQIVDLQHITENLSMNGSESARFTKMLSHTLHSRRELKDFFDTFNTLQKDANRLKMCINDMTPRFVKYVDQQERSYVFRTPEMFDFVQSFKNAESRSRVTIEAPKGMSQVMKPESISPIQEDAVTAIVDIQKEGLQVMPTLLKSVPKKEVENTVKDTQIPAPAQVVVEPSTNTDSINRVYRNGKTWFIDIDEAVVFSSDKVEEIVLYLIDKNIQEFRTGAKAKQFLVSGIAKIKRMKKNTSLYYMEKMNELDTYLKAS